MSLELQSLLPYPNSCLGASPHQQGRDTKMEMLSFGGIDFSKDRLDITVLPDEQCSPVSSDAAGSAELIEQLRGSWITPTALDATGGADPAPAHRFRLLTSMPGVGAVLACTLIALLPELGQMSRKQVPLSSGLRPMTSIAASSKDAVASGVVARASATCSTWPR